MRPGAGKGKGSSFERKAGEKLSLWLSKGQRKDLLCRTVGSGAQFTSVGLGIAGDLRAQDGTLAFELFSLISVECKFWKDLELINFLNGKGNLFEAVKHTEKQATQCKKLWILIAKQNNRPELIFMPTILSINIEGVRIHELHSGMMRMLNLSDFVNVEPRVFIDSAKRVCERIYGKKGY